MSGNCRIKIIFRSLREMYQIENHIYIVISIKPYFESWGSIGHCLEYLTSHFEAGCIHPRWTAWQRDDSQRRACRRKYLTTIVIVLDETQQEGREIWKLRGTGSTWQSWWQKVYPDSRCSFDQSLPKTCSFFRSLLSFQRLVTYYLEPKLSKTVFPYCAEWYILEVFSPIQAFSKFRSRFCSSVATWNLPHDKINNGHFYARYHYWHWYLEELDEITNPHSIEQTPKLINLITSANNQDQKSSAHTPSSVIEQRQRASNGRHQSPRSQGEE